MYSILDLISDTTQKWRCSSLRVHSSSKILTVLCQKNIHGFSAYHLWPAILQNCLFTLNLSISAQSCKYWARHSFIYWISSCLTENTPSFLLHNYSAVCIFQVFCLNSTLSKHSMRVKERVQIVTFVGPRDLSLDIHLSLKL